MYDDVINLYDFGNDCIAHILKHISSQKFLYTRKFMECFLSHEELLIIMDVPSHVSYLAFIPNRWVYKMVEGFGFQVYKCLLLCCDIICYNVERADD